MNKRYYTALTEKSQTKMDDPEPLSWAERRDCSYRINISVNYEKEILRDSHSIVLHIIPSPRSATSISAAVVTIGLSVAVAWPAGRPQSIRPA
jgi:hypothetical protein